MEALAKVERGGALAPTVAAAEEFLRAAKSPATIRAYRSDWADFSAWCSSHSLGALPAAPETVALYLSDLAATLRPSTLARRLASISVAHKSAVYPSPTGAAVVRETLKGIRRTLGAAQVEKAAVRVSHLRQVIPDLPATLQGRRDRALILVGYAGAFRRSELVSLDRADVIFSVEGARVTLRRSKTDQEAQGSVKAIAYGSHKDTCPVRALQDWLNAAGIVEGPIFRPINRHGQVGAGRLSGKAVSLVIKRLAARFGLEAAEVGGHSLRAGLITDLYSRGTAEQVIMGVSGHRSRNVLGRYRREADVFSFNQVAAVGL